MFTTLIIAATLVVVLIIPISLFSRYYEYHGIGSQDGVFRGGSSKDKEVALTFDDGPSPEFTPRVLDILKKKQVKASFFLNGEMAKNYPDIVKRTALEGHDVGNHTYSHVNMILLSDEALAWEIDQGEKAVQAAMGTKPTLFRPPRGLFNGKVRRALISRGYRVVLWTVSSADWRPGSERFIAPRVRKGLKPGAVILFHDGGAIVKNKGGQREGTVSALPEVIDMIRDAGYRLVKVSELMRD